MFRQKRPVSNLALSPILLILPLVLSLTSCSPPGGSVITETKSSQRHPAIFSSDEIALDGAALTYESYFEVSDEIASRVGEGRTAIDPLVSPDFLVTTYAGFDELAAQSLHTSGRTVVKNITLQSRSEASGLAKVSIYVCVDVSDVIVLNVAGEDVTPPERADYLAFVADLQSQSPASANLVLTENKPWSGASFC
jgi:hypothetical protein